LQFHRYNEIMKTTTKITIGIVAVIFAGLLYDSYANIAGFYIPILNRIVCSDKHTCLHETGHSIDYRRGHISQSYEFAETVQIFRIVSNTNNTVDEMSYRIRKFPGIGSDYEQTTCRLFIKCEPEGWGGYSELYAEIYAMADGNINNIPEVFRPFYEVTND
jgi:hypothetical protein